MADKAPPKDRPVLGRVRTHLKIGVVGLPNVGKSSLFSLLTKLEVKCENYPFCTIEPNNAKVALPDTRWRWLCDHFKPKEEIPNYLEVVDIAGLVKGASSGAGLGNKFLSHISAVDGIFHLIRIFEDEDVTHVEGTVDPVRDLDIISSELRLKDIETIETKYTPMARLAKSDPTKRGETAVYEKLLEWLKSGKDIKDGDWTPKEVEILMELLLITAKPAVYLINMSEEDYIKQKNKWLAKIATWVKTNSPSSPVIPLCVSLEQKLYSMSEAERKTYLEEKKTKSQLDKVISTGFQQLQLVNFYTCGEKEVRAWPLQKGMKAPQAAGTIHSDFEEYFIKAEVYNYNDLKELGSEASVKASGKYRTHGKEYEIQDGDIILIKHNAGGGKKKK